jgi:hypothetical protein
MQNFGIVSTYLYKSTMNAEGKNKKETNDISRLQEKHRIGGL